jgi:hypothetical protein
LLPAITCPVAGLCGPGPDPVINFTGDVLKRVIKGR